MFQGITIVACSHFYLHLATACYCKLSCTFSASLVCSQVINVDQWHESQLVLSFPFCSVLEREVRCKSRWIKKLFKSVVDYQFKQGLACFPQAFSLVVGHGGIASARFVTSGHCTNCCCTCNVRASKYIALRFNTFQLKSIQSMKSIEIKQK